MGQDVHIKIDKYVFCFEEISKGMVHRYRDYNGHLSAVGRVFINENYEIVDYFQHDEEFITLYKEAIQKFKKVSPLI